MDRLFLQHPVFWWKALDFSSRLAVLAVLLGLCCVLVATWFGVRRRWRNWNQAPGVDEEDEDDEDARTSR